MDQMGSPHLLAHGLGKPVAKTTGQMLYASDHPWVEPKLIRDTLESLNLPPADSEKIFTTNARKLFQL